MPLSSSASKPKDLNDDDKSLTDISNTLDDDLGVPGTIGDIEPVARESRNGAGTSMMFNGLLTFAVFLVFKKHF